MKAHPDNPNHRKDFDELLEKSAAPDVNLFAEAVVAHYAQTLISLGEEWQRDYAPKLCTPEPTPEQLEEWATKMKRIRDSTPPDKFVDYGTNVFSEIYTVIPVNLADNADVNPLPGERTGE